MKPRLEQIKRLLEDEEGASAIEYALLVGLISVALVASLTALGKKVADIFTKAASVLPS